MTRVKVCGLTRAEDVRLAAELAESPRPVVPAQARTLAAEAGDAITVAVVTTQTAPWIAGAVATAGLAAVQLSAGADGPSVADMRAAAAEAGVEPLVIAAADTPDAELADFLLEQEAVLEESKGAPYCPCQVRTHERDHDMTIVCPCIPFHRAHFDAMRRCWCGLFVHQDVTDPDSLPQIAASELGIEE